MDERDEFGIVIKDRGRLVKDPEGGHCYIDGMGYWCYGCVYYGCGLIEECRKRVKRIREYYLKEIGKGNPVEIIEYSK
jgi:hypothetical protein